VNMRVRGCVRALFALGAIGCLNGTAHCAVVPDLGNKFAFFDEIGNPGNPPPPGSTWTNTYDVSNNIISSTVATANDPVAMTFTQGAGGLTGVPINATLNYSATSVTPYTGTAAPTSFTETFSLDKLTITATGATPGTTAGENLLTIVPVGGAGTGVPSLFGTTGTNATSATRTGPTSVRRSRSVSPPPLNPLPTRTMTTGSWDGSASLPRRTISIWRAAQGSRCWGPTVTPISGWRTSSAERTVSSARTSLLFLNRACSLWAGRSLLR